MPSFPKQIDIQADIEIEIVVSGKLLREFHARENSFMNLRVGVELNVFPNYYNIVVLRDANDEIPPIRTQCNGVYNPDKENLAAGEYPAVRLDRNIREPPSAVLENLFQIDPRIVFAGDSSGVSITDVTPAREPS